jgi:hypothetical protein
MVVDFLQLFHFTVTPFGLANSPFTFERLMEDVLRGLQWEECLLFSLAFPGVDQFCTATMLSESVCTPSSETTWPKNLTDFCNSIHFDEMTMRSALY